MSNRPRVALLCTLATLACFSAGIATAKDGVKPKEGYLGKDGIDIVSLLPPAPVPGDPRYDADRAVFQYTRALEGSPRWQMATNDVKTGAADMMADFSCAVGVSLTPQNAPRLLRLMGRAGRDTNKSSYAAKMHFQRQRPFHLDDGQTCQPKEELGDSFDYPSGHTTWGWTWAEILAELAPDKAAAALARGRAYGESRIVCGAHNASAVASGYLTASATLAAVRASKAYRADFAAARKELIALRKSGPKPDAARCQAEADLVAEDIFHHAAP